MALWRLPGEWDDYEWFRLADVKEPRTRPRQTRPRPGSTSRPPAGAAPVPRGAGSADQADDAGAAMGQWLVRRVQEDSPWSADPAYRVLLVDLDNLRAAPSRLRARLDLVVHLAREADLAAFAGQAGAVRRSRPWLAEFASRAEEVPDGSDLADHALLARAGRVRRKPVQFVVVSNDGIFSRLADRGELGLVSPGADALSDRLRDAAQRVLDLTELERQAAAERARAQRRARRHRP